MSVTVVLGVILITWPIWFVAIGIALQVWQEKRHPGRVRTSFADVQRREAERLGITRS